MSSYCCRTYPLHDSDSILLLKTNNYRKQLEAVKKWYINEYDNWHTVSGEASRWWMWDKTRKYALTSAQQIQQYLSRVSSGENNFLYNCSKNYNICLLGCAAALRGLCVTPSEFQSRLGEFGEYCPVSLSLRDELVNSQDKLTFAAEYR